MTDHRNVICFSKNTFENLIFLPVMLNGLAVTAMFDTGAQMSFITESISKQLGKPAVTSVLKAGNNQGAEAAFETRDICSFQIGSSILTDLKMGVLPNEALDFGVDSRQHTFPAAMLLGWDILSRFCWEFDMNAKAVTVTKGGCMPRGNDLSWEGFPVVTVAYAGADYRIGFDSGHTETFLDNTWSDRISIFTETETLVQGIGSARAEQVKVVREFCFQLGDTDIRLCNIEITGHEVYGAAQSNICGLLGADILQGAKWTLDYQSRCFKIMIPG